MISGQGHAAFGFSNAGAQARINAGTCGRLAGDAAGATQTPALYTSSTTAYNPSSDPGGSNGRRWGDYSYVSLDPIDDMTMGSVEQYCDATNSYGCRVAKLIAPPPATPSVLADIAAGQGGVAVTLTGASVSGSGYYDPGADLMGVPAFAHLTAAITNGTATGTPPVVTSATYVNPTTVNLVINASVATANLPGQYYTITVTNPDGQAAAAAIVRVIGASVPEATLAVGPTTAEGNGGTTPFNFMVNLSAPASSNVKVRYHTSDGTATVADGDYAAAIDSLTIPIGNSSGTIHVNVAGDTKYELDETFSVTLTSAVNATLGSGVTADGTIQNDDPAPTVALDNLSINEGQIGTTEFAFTATLSAASGLPASASYETADGTATVADGDYQAAAGTVSFDPGETIKPITVLVNGDTRNEANETFSLTLADLAGISAVTAQGAGTILNDDAVPSLSISAAATAAEGNDGQTPFVFNVSLSAASGSPVTVRAKTADGTATAGSDYAAQDRVLTFAPGTTAVADTVFVTGDLCGERDENFTLALSEPGGATIAADTGSGTIQNDDDATAPTVAVTAPNGGESLLVGAMASIQWTATDEVGVTAVDIYLSRDNGATYAEEIATGIANSGAFDWTVTDPIVVSPAVFVKVVAHDGGCNSAEDVSDAAFAIVNDLTAVNEGPVTQFALTGIRPNPTGGSALIQYQLPKQASVRLMVVDLRGRVVSKLVDGDITPGRHVATWTGRGRGGPAPAGIYFVLYEANGQRFHKKLVLTR
jgi:hypothetical protein